MRYPSCAMPRWVRKQLRSRWRLVAMRALLMLGALALVLTVVRGGTRFFYCPITHHVFDAPPCSVVTDDDAASDSDAPAVRAADCCEEKWRPFAPAASAQRVPDTNVASAPIAFLDFDRAQLETLLSSSKASFALARSVRAGPSPPSAAKRRAQLMIFHI